MKQLLIIVLFVICSLSALADDFWTYYPVFQDRVRKPCCRLRIAGDSLYTVRPNANSKEVYPDTLYLFDLKTEMYCSLFPLPNPYQDVIADDYGNIWILEDQLWKYDGDSLYMVEVFPDLLPFDEWHFFTSDFTKSPSGDIFFGSGNILIQLSKGEVSKLYNFKDLFDFDDYPAYFMDNGSGNEMVWIDNYCVFWGAPVRCDSILFVDLNNPDDNKSYKFESMDVRDSSYIVWLKSYEDELFLNTINSSTSSIEGRFKGLYSFKNEELKEIKLEYLEENYFHLLIHDFEVDPKGNLVFSISRFEPHPELNDTLRIDEFVFFDREGNFIETYPTPIMDNDINGVTTGQYQYWGADDLVNYNDGIYAAPLSYWYHQGIIRLTPEHLVGIDDEESIEGGVKFKLVHISSAFPNPVKDFATIKFFCIPTLYSDFEINVYDYIGREYDNVTYEILDYNSREGWGHAKISLELLPKGPKYLILKAQEETDCVNIMLY